MVAVLGLGGLAAIGAPRSAAQSGGKLAAAAPVTYDNRYELYGGLNYMNFQAGQNVPKLMNLGGGEFSGTYWFNDRWGGVLDARIDAGTTPVVPNFQFNGRAVAILYTGMAGAQYRVLAKPRGAFNLHAYAGASYGDFTQTIPTNLSGLYSNRTKPIGAFGGSFDLNRSKNLAVRLSPDLIVEHFGSEYRQFFSISGGVIYRIGRR